MKSKKSISNLEEMTSVIQSLLKIHRKISSEKVQDEIKKTIHTLLSPDLWGQEHAVSLKAQEFAKKKGYEKSLELSSWNDLRNEKLKDPKKTTPNSKRGLALEHIILRSDIIALLFECDSNNYNKIEEIVSHTKCTVIHWSEDAKVNKDYKDNRPDPKEAYEKANIKLKFPSGCMDISDFIDSDWVDKHIKNLYPKKQKKQSSRHEPV